ncbi:MAG: signal peptidase I [Lachnospiraceae bacterium]|nr:signal peptidase I [Lachnospiraceae bacterium]MBD5504397.1 signal peptidase I [Lachnospiraceae bacterium]
MIEAELKKEQHKNKYHKALRSTVYALIVVAAVTVIIAVLVFPVLQITGTSMTDTLQSGDIVIALNSRSYKAGDVVAFYYNNEVLVKRVIACAGDWVDIDVDGNVTVNGEAIYEPYISEKSLGYCDITLPYQVPDGRNFMMGDHRETSMDSRNSAIGCISDDLVVGKIFFCVWPFADFGVVK